jgi:hypothetical protein
MSVSSIVRDFRSTRARMRSSQPAGPQSRTDLRLRSPSPAGRRQRGDYARLAAGERTIEITVSSASRGRLLGGREVAKYAELGH